MSKRSFTVDISGNEHLEQWRPIPGFVGKYEASNLGRIRSARGILKQRLHITRRYPVVELSLPPGSREHLVHRLVLLAFRGEPPVGNECRHLNGNRTDNRLVNLAWGTHSENSIDQVIHGTHRETRRTHCLYGHLFDDANTIITPKGHRKCRACKRLYDNARYHASRQ